MARLSAGVEISSSAIRLALVSFRPNPTVVQVLEQELGRGEDARAGAIAAQALDRLRAKHANVHLAFTPGRPGAMRHQLFVTPKRLRQAELKALALRELKRDSALDQNSALVALERLGPMDGPAAGDTHLLVALAKGEVEPAAAALLNERKVVRSATSSAMALYRAAAVSDLPTQGVTALVLLDQRHSSLIVLDEGLPRFFRDLPGLSGAREVVSEGAASQALARELEISLVYFAQQHRPKQVETVMVVGAPALADPVAHSLEESPKYRVVRFGPSPKLAVDPAVKGPLSPFAVAIGAALGPKTRPVPDVLPVELKGRPERAIAFVGIALLVVALMTVIVQVRRGRFVAFEREQTRLSTWRDRYQDVARKVQNAKKIDAELAQAQAWKHLFDHYDRYHRRAAELFYALPAALPADAKLTSLLLAPPLPSAGGEKTVPSSKAPNWQLKLKGIVEAQDLPSAQTELASLVANARKLPAVTDAVLEPITQPTTKEDAKQGALRLPFTLDLSVRDTIEELEP